MKIALITHGADPDGAFPIILSRLVFDNIDDYSCEVGEVDNILSEILSMDYEKVYIVDLTMSDSMAEQINQNEILKNKIMVFDHHESRMHMNQYSFINIRSSIDGVKECGTTIYYKYLIKNYDKPILHKKSLIELIELVRQGDTYDFVDKEIALKFDKLYNIYGREKYIDIFYQYILENDQFSFTDTQELLINLEENRMQKYIEKKLSHMKKATINGVKVGIVLAEQYRSELGHEMAEKNDDIDIAIIINADKSVSYRANKDEVDVNMLAVPYGGGGHKHAAGSPLPERFKENLLELIYKDIEWVIEDGS